MLKRFVILSVMLFSYAAFANAASIAFIDGTAVMKKYEGTIENTLKGEFKSKEETLTKMQKELVDSTETYTRDSAMMSNEEKLAFQQTFEKKQMEFQKLSSELNQERMKRGNEELEKLLAKVKTAAQKVAADKKFDVVLQSGAAIYFDKSYDITQDVLAQLDKK
ncbi:MAG: OmpH family outer membrane protein [Gammaproteobacteria bacterium]